MDDFLKSVTSDFGFIATTTGFRFNQYSGLVDWEYLEECVLDDIIKNADVETLSLLVASVLCYNIEKMSASKKLFRLSQLIIDFLLHFKKHSTFKLHEEVDSMAQCKLCGKIFMDINYLKYHCFRRHKLNSCTYTSEDEHVRCLKTEMVQLQTQLEDIKSTFQNKLHSSMVDLEEQNPKSCHQVHKNKLSYNLFAQAGDNPMQTQEMYWKQKYDSLEENYNNLKNKYEKISHTVTTNNGLPYKNQHCQHETEKFSKYVQTYSLTENTTFVCSPERPPRKIDVCNNKNKEICNMDMLDTEQTNSECHHLVVDGSSDKDVYELKKLREEAYMNIIENNICENYSSPILSSDYVDGLKVVLKLEKTQLDELFKNAYLIDLIKFDVKELVNKRLEEFYRSADENMESDNFLLKKNLCDNQETFESNLVENSSPRIDVDKTIVKKNKTIISKLKKTFGFGKVQSPGSSSKKVELESPIRQDSGFNSTDKLNNDNDVLM